MRPPPASDCGTSPPCQRNEVHAGSGRTSRRPARPFRTCERARLHRQRGRHEMTSFGLNLPAMTWAARSSLAKSRLKRRRSTVRYASCSSYDRSASSFCHRLMFSTCLARGAGFRRGVSGDAGMPRGSIPRSLRRWSRRARSQSRRRATTVIISDIGHELQAAGWAVARVVLTDSEDEAVL